MPRLVDNVSGTAANTDSVLSPPSPAVNPAVQIPNNDPLNVTNSLLYTIYGWAANWGSAQVQIFISPQEENSLITPVWFPLLDSNGNPVILTANKYLNFQVRFGFICAQVIDATTNTSGLCCTLFNPSQIFPPGSP